MLRTTHSKSQWGHISLTLKCYLFIFILKNYSPWLTTIHLATVWNSDHAEGRDLGLVPKVTATAVSPPQAYDHNWYFTHSYDQPALLGPLGLLPKGTHSRTAFLRKRINWCTAWSFIETVLHHSGNGCHSYDLFLEGCNFWEIVQMIPTSRMVQQLGNAIFGRGKWSQIDGQKWRNKVWDQVGCKALQGCLRG